MKGKLIKREKGYALISEDGTQPLGSTLSKAEGHKLSLKNCQAIERGYDLDELAKNEYRNFPSKANGEEPLPRWGEDQHATKKQKAYKKGFMKALELMGDKKFSEEDMSEAIQFGLDGMYGYKPGKDGYTEVQKKKYIQSLQKTEWSVEVVMGDPIEVGDKYTPENFPKLDEDGCIILKNLYEKLHRN